MAKVQISGDENIREALRRFKKMCDKEGIINQSKRMAYFEKPSERKRREESRRIKNIKRSQKIRHLRATSHDPPSIRLPQ